MKSKVIIILTSIIVCLLNTSWAEKDLFSIARLKYGGGGDWYNDPSCIPNMLKELKKRTGIDTQSDQVIIELSDIQLFKYPFLFMTGHGNVLFSNEDAVQLKLYLENGGFLYVDDDYGLNSSFRKELKKVFPNKPLVELSFNHKIYNCHYSFSKGLPKIHEHDNKPARGYGIFHKDRLVLFYSYESNISDGWADPEVHKDPENVREAAFRMGTNIMVYSLMR